MKLDAETKSIITDLINKFVKILNINVLSGTVFEQIKKGYDKGINEAEAQFDLNFTRDSERLQFLQKYSFDNIIGMNDDIADKLRSELQRGFMNLESTSKIQERIKKVMGVAEDRARVIARTEMNRAQNMGHLDSAKQTGLKVVKRWDAHLDKRTSEVCRYLDGKEVPLNKKFKWEGQEFDAPPAHPNCRSTLIFIQK